MHLGENGRWYVNNVVEGNLVQRYASMTSECSSVDLIFFRAGPAVVKPDSESQVDASEDVL